MAIEHAEAEQADDTRFRSSFTIQFKIIRIAGAATVSVGQLAGRAAIQSAKVTQNGTAGKVPVDTATRQSLLSRMLEGQ